MEWLNLFGLGFMVLILVPNIIFAVRCHDGFQNLYHNRPVLALEQIGRYGCFVTMIINIPKTVFGFASDEAFALYLIVDSLLVLVYLAVWLFMWKKNGLLRTVLLSLLPASVFLFSALMSRSLLLGAFSVVFLPCHLIVGWQNATTVNKSE
ncbi:MAG: hypothetical protein PUC33_01045 [Oscillospiraceae bacterium]|nr:hypothetical protein [Oscillospiraceae bacterium]MDD6147283.1 hypothetical protein [Oscillospiraceae bacterium]